MNLQYFQRLPTDVIKYILPFDKRFILRNGEIFAINKLDQKKYGSIINQLTKKNKIIVSYSSHYQYDNQNIMQNSRIGYCHVNLSRKKMIRYNIDFQRNQITYAFIYKPSRYSEKIIHSCEVL